MVYFTEDINLMKSLSLKYLMEKDLQVNLFVVLLFGFLNPFYALSICAVLNMMNSRINYRLFSFMFALSFTLLFFARDWRLVGSHCDAIEYIRSYQMSSSLSLSDIFNQFLLHPKGQEPFWNVYLWLFQKLVGGHVGIFIFFNYFLVFLLTTYLGKVVGGKRFVIVVFCIISVNLFFIGIFKFETNKSKLVARSLMYSSALFHLVTVPLVLLYEVFILFTRKNTQFQKKSRTQMIISYSIKIITYGLILALIIKLTDEFGASIAPSFNLSSVFDYEVESNIDQTGFYLLFNPLSYVVIFYFWYNRKQISKNDIYIGINYFFFIAGLWLLSLPSSPMGRIIYVFLVGASILSSKLILTNFRLGFICLLVIIGHNFNILSHTKTLAYLLNGEYLNPVYGITVMIYNYDTLFVLPGSV